MLAGLNDYCGVSYTNGESSMRAQYMSVCVAEMVRTLLEESMNLIKPKANLFVLTTIINH